MMNQYKYITIVVVAALAILSLTAGPASARVVNTQNLHAQDNVQNLLFSETHSDKVVKDSYIVVLDPAHISNQNSLRSHFMALGRALFDSSNLVSLYSQRDTNQVLESFADNLLSHRTSYLEDIASETAAKTSRSRKRSFYSSLMGDESKQQSFFFSNNNANEEEATPVSSFSFPEFLGFKLNHHYSVDGLFGYAAVFSQDILQQLESDSLVSFIEPNRIVTAFGTQKDAPSWGLGRISARKVSSPKKTSSKYVYPDSAGTNVDAYVIDTGIYLKHPDFEGRARLGKSFTADGSTNDDNGHGTHVAGTIGSTTYGIAKSVSLIAVKVLDGNGSGTTADVIAGIQFVAVEAPKTGRKSVANMSLGGGKSTALDMAVKAAVDAGVVMVVAAGNSRGDACRLSPGSSPYAITVAASDINDKLAYFSEHGKCVDIIAPGVDITSTWNNGDINTISGTSMASPHVAGVVALALAESDFKTPEDVKLYLKTISSKDRISGQLFGTINDLLYNHVEGGKIPDEEPAEPKEPSETDPSPPDENVCPFPQCLIDPACTDCDFGFSRSLSSDKNKQSKINTEKAMPKIEDIHIVIDHVAGEYAVSVEEVF